MNHERFPDAIPTSLRPGWRLALVFFAMVLIGAATFVMGILGEDARRAWQAYLINFVFWSGMAYGAVLFSAVLNMAKARWARPLKRLTEAPGAFLPFSLAFFGILYLGREEIFPWIHEPVHGKEWWLDITSLFARDGAGLFLLTAVALSLIYFSLREDRKVAFEQAKGSPSGSAAPSTENTVSRGWRAQVFLSPILGILYALVLSLLAVDLIMSLDPHWVSTLFGAYYFISSLYTALAAIIIIAIFSMSTAAFREVIQPKHMHDLGKLLLAFCLLTGDFFYSQFLVIWYGNLPEEARYVLLRVRHAPWEPMAWTVLFVCFVLPFAALLSRRIKMKPRQMLILSSIILIGMWLERFLLVAPSIWREGGIPLGFMELLITGGFLGTMALCVLGFLRWAPALPVSDPLYRASIQQGGQQH